jgi:hypothetical protein
MVAGAIVNQFGTGLGVLAGGIAVGGFLSHVGPALAGGQEDELRRATARGGLTGFGIAAGVIVLSALIDTLTV